MRHKHKHEDADGDDEVGPFPGEERDEVGPLPPAGTSQGQRIESAAVDEAERAGD